MVSAIRSRWGQRLGQKKWEVSYWAQKYGKSPDFARNQDFLVRVAIQNFSKNAVISTVSGFRTTKFLACNFIFSHQIQGDC